MDEIKSPDDVFAEAIRREDTVESLVENPYSICIDILSEAKQPASIFDD